MLDHFQIHFPKVELKHVLLIINTDFDKAPGQFNTKSFCMQENLKWKLKKRHFSSLIRHLESNVGHVGMIDARQVYQHNNAKNHRTRIMASQLEGVRTLARCVLLSPPTLVGW